MTKQVLLALVRTATSRTLIHAPPTHDNADTWPALSGIPRVRAVSA